MSLPYTLVEKSVLRKPNSTKSIGNVLTDTVAWMNSLEEGNSVANFFYYAEVIDSDTKQRYFVYSDEAVAYFGLADNIVEADSASSGGVSLPAGGTVGQILSKSSDVDGEAEWIDNIPSADVVSGLDLKYGIYACTKVYPAVGAYFPFLNTISPTSTIDSAQVVDEYTLLLKAGRTYKIDGGIESTTESSGVITARMYIYDLDGSNEISVNDTYTYSYHAVNRNFRAGGFITPDHDVHLKTMCTYNDLVSPTGLTMEFTISEYTKNTVSLSTTDNVIMPGYSTDETLTTERWIDGKPIYKKTVDFGALPNNTSKTVAHNIVNVEQIWLDETTSSWSGGTGNGVPMNYYAGSGFVVTYPTITDIYCKTNTNYSPYTAVVTVRYTKTTDTASSPVAQVSIPSLTPFIFSATTARATSTMNPLTFSSIHVDTMSAASGNSVVIPEDGIYEIHINGIVKNASQFFMYKNEQLITHGYENDDRAQISISAVRNLVAGDEITFGFTNVSSGSMYNDAEVIIKRIG